MFDCLFSILDLSAMEKKHTRNFSLDVHPYMLTIRKPKVETTAAEPLPSEHNMDTVYLEGTHTIVHVSGAITGRPYYVCLILGMHDISAFHNLICIYSLTPI